MRCRIEFRVKSRISMAGVKVKECLEFYGFRVYLGLGVYRHPGSLSIQGLLGRGVYRHPGILRIQGLLGFRGLPRSLNLRKLKIN